MFSDRLKNLLMEENPLKKIDKKSDFNDKVEAAVCSLAGQWDDAPDFFQQIEDKSLTKDKKDATMEDSDIVVEIQALKKLIEKYKGEDNGR